MTGRPGGSRFRASNHGSSLNSTQTSINDWFHHKKGLKIENSTKTRSGFFEGIKQYTLRYTHAHIVAIEEAKLSTKLVSDQETSVSRERERVPRERERRESRERTEVGEKRKERLIKGDICRAAGA